MAIVKCSNCDTKVSDRSLKCSNCGHSIDTESPAIKRGLRNLSRFKPSRWVYLIFAMGVVSLVIRSLLSTQFANTALLYVAIPFIISFLLFHFARNDEREGFGAHLLDATILMFGTSAFLFEGFICVLFFYPIYILFAAIGYAVAAGQERRRQKGEENHLKSSFIPLIIAVMAIEGTAPSTSFERHNSVTREFIIAADVTTIQTNMAAPVDLPKKRNWFLSIFPLPIETRAGSLNVGDVHEMDFVYKRWFFTNIKMGQMALRIDTVSEDQITTSIVKNTSYLSTYLKIIGSEINFTPLPDGDTHVSLTMNYERLLDPAWYFGPLQHYAVSHMCDYFVDANFAREADYKKVNRNGYF